MNDRCETTANFPGGRCDQTATTRLTHNGVGLVALACSEHAAMWLRSKRGRRVHPLIVAEPIVK